MKFKTALLCTAILTATVNSYANPVPAGTVLAEKQEIVLNNSAEVTSIDPAKQGAEPAFNLGRDLFEGLTLQDKLGRTIPGIATSWSANSDNTVYTFTLRESTWSNGEPLTANDFVYSWQRLIDPATASPYAWFAAIPGIKNADAIMKGDKPASSLGVRAIDAQTFEVTLAAPVPFFVKLLSHPVLAP
ncbi:peptide ABC transporter substrate-binding protein, partial ['Osedax' symbiont bacterium Rs2_46_30_T18]